MADQEVIGQVRPAADPGNGGVQLLLSLVGAVEEAFEEVAPDGIVEVLYFNGRVAVVLVDGCSY